MPIDYSKTRIKVARFEIDEVIESYLKGLHDLRARRNELAPISVLPAEILAIIFCKTIPVDVYDSSTPLGCVTVSHVCSQWRTVALNCPRLWTQPPLRKRALVSEMLKRSKSAPLSIVGCGTEFFTSASSALWLVRTHLRRVQEIRLSTDNLTHERLFAWLRAAPSLTVRVLDISARSRRVLDFPPDILRILEPCLRVLCLERCAMPWSAPFPANLTELSLKNIAADYRPTSQELASVVNALPQLEHLKISDALPTDRDGAVTTVSQAGTRTLSATISGTPNQCGHFFRRFPLTIGPYLKLVSVGTARSAVMMSFILSLAPTIRALAGTVSLSATSQQGHLQIRLEALGPPVPHVDLLLRWRDPSNRSYWPSWTALLDHLSASKVVGVDLSLEDTDKTPPTVRSSAVVTSLRLTCYTVPRIVALLGSLEGKDSGTSSVNTAPLWPRLDHLTLEAVNFDNGKPNEFEGCIRRRLACGVGPHTLLLKRCSGTMGFIDNDDFTLIIENSPVDYIVEEGEE
ncbi:hypothetical protein PLICRDRAFT_229153 [Plicaturopsis crispa FD-325 SS-3]|nr:hypothetical protein PLICRDRAFT_229153 [Plicaturopsis crispa FD-325 SS-3]